MLLQGCTLCKAHIAFFLGANKNECGNWFLIAVNLFSLIVFIKLDCKKIQSSVYYNLNQLKCPISRMYGENKRENSF